MSRHTIKLPDDVSDQARVLAKESGMTFDAWINALVTREVVRKGVESYTEHARADQQPRSEPGTVEDGASHRTARKDNDNRCASAG